MKYKLGKEMKYALIKFDGQIIARAERIYFPKVRTGVKEVMINNRVKIYEDDVFGVEEKK